MIHDFAFDRFCRSCLVLATIGALVVLPGCPVDSNADIGDTDAATMTTASTTMTTGMSMSSTTADTEADSSGSDTNVGPVEFADILPIFTDQCAVDSEGGGCHQMGGTWGPPIVPDFDLTEANAYMSLLEGNPTESILNYVEPGDPEMSYLLYKLRGDQVDAPGGGSGVQMPQAPPMMDFVALPASDIARIEAWIMQGAAE
ncbi:MAG TPA: hypothetical protein VG755_21865 [Nannocystaceae bacterium]|nr:hypothetical protein [Nannocystaceae bacterium]